MDALPRRDARIDPPVHVVELELDSPDLQSNAKDVAESDSGEQLQAL